jgi:hypothetical protein
MRPEDVLEVLRRRPFRPFRIHVSDGTTYEVQHPDWIWVGRSAAMVFIPDLAHFPFVHGRYEIVALLHMVRLEWITPAISIEAN